MAARGSKTTAPDPAADPSATTDGGGVALMDRPDDAQQPAIFTTPDGLTELAGQQVHFLCDEDGKVCGADVVFWRHTAERETAASYRAEIRWQDGQVVWREADADGKMFAVKRGQHTMRLLPVVEAAVENGFAKVLAGWIT